jgi:putative MFS transporter
MENVKSFEEITEDRIGFGRYQYYLMILLGIIFLSDGMEMTALSLIIPLLKKEWGISEGLIGTLGSVMFLGLFLGSLVSGFVTDKLGRKRTLEVISLVQFILGVYSTTINNVYIFLFIRGIFGFILGYVIPLVPTMCAEIIPMNLRGKVTVVINTIFSVGQFLAAIISYFCLSNLSSGNWRLLLLICSIPPILVWYGCVKYLRESPRFIILKDNNIDDGIKILNEIGRINKGDNFKEFNESDKISLKIWKEQMNNMHHNFDDVFMNFKKLFSKTNNYRLITTCMWIAWFGINFVCYGLIFILPLFLNEWDLQRQSEKKTTEGIISFIITSLGEGASGILAYFLVDTHTFGRKYSLTLAQVCSSLSCLLAYFISFEYGFLLISVLTIGRFFAKMCFAVIYPFTAEIYPTSIRTLGVGMSSAFGRVAGCIMPLIAVKLFYIDKYLPFISFFVVGIFGLAGTLSIPHDTRGKYLDMHDVKNEKSQELRKDLL